VKTRRALVLATRGSRLALRQAELVIEALRAVSPEVQVETRVVRTEGDRRQEAPLEEIGGQGVFVKDIELRLAKGEVDVAVHSLKDMPALTPPGLIIAAVLRRGDVRDALISRRGEGLEALPAGARIGTDSRRRAVQLLALRREVEPVSIRGNVETRLRKVEAGEYDAAVLAVAGLERLGLLDRASQVFSVDELLPAVGQGALAAECRTNDADVLALLRRVDHRETHLAVAAERAFLARLGAGCRLPVGAYAEVAGNRLRLRAMLADEAGRVQREEAEGPVSEGERLGVELAERLLSQAALGLAKGESAS